MTKIDCVTPSIWYYFSLDCQLTGAPLGLTLATNQIELPRSLIDTSQLVNACVCVGDMMTSHVDDVDDVDDVVMSTHRKVLGV
jgi:hypothetical protein